MSEPVLDSVDKLRRAFYRLMNTDAADDDLIEHDEESGEAVNLYLQAGIENAQEYIISFCDPARWVKRSSAIVTANWQSSDDLTGGRYVALATYASDFLRAAGDENETALREADGTPWGKLLTNVLERFSRTGDYYYLIEDQLWITKDADPPDTLYLHYHYRHPLLVDTNGTDLPAASINFALMDRPLIVAFAGEEAIDDNWPAGGPEMRTRIINNLNKRKARAARRSRRTRQPKQFKAERPIGTHWMEL